MKKSVRLNKIQWGLLALCFLLAILLSFLYLRPSHLQEYENAPLADPERIEGGIHLRTGLVDAEGLPKVLQHCTPCHSAKLITQNRMDAAAWEQTILWMQETQNLWDLGEDKEIIIQYLTKNYPPRSKGRRQGLKDIEWYALNPG